MSQLTEMIPQIAPERHQLLVKVAAQIQADPYRDEIIQEMDAIIQKAESVVKTAAAPKMMRNSWEIAKGVGMGAAAVTAGGIALALAGDLYEAAKRGITRGRDYKKMLEANPDLKMPSKSAKVKASFSTLHRFNPDFAKDPYVAGSYVRNSIEIPGSEVASAKDLVKARSDMQRSKELPGMGNLPGSIMYG